jgi:hypothetical protein
MGSGIEFTQLKFHIIISHKIEYPKSNFFFSKKFSRQKREKDLGDIRKRNQRTKPPQATTEF